MTDKERKLLLQFFERNPHPPWMDDPRYFRNSELEDDEEEDVA